MFEMAKNSASLFFQGRLFADNKAAYRRIAMGIAATAVIMVLGVLVGLPLWAAALGAGFIGGALQSFLFKSLKYR
jgi:hypothetical protein